MSATATYCAVLGRLLNVSVPEAPLASISCECAFFSAVVWTLSYCMGLLWAGGGEQMPVKDRELLDDLIPQCLSA